LLSLQAGLPGSGLSHRAEAEKIIAERGGLRELDSLDEETLRRVCRLLYVREDTCVSLDELRGNINSKLNGVISYRKPNTVLIDPRLVRAIGKR